MKSGLSRHVVRFVRVKNKRFAIKETSAETAEKEYQSYLRLRRFGIPTLEPVGTIVRDEGLVATPTSLGPQLESKATGYLITRLLEYAIPDSYLFRRAFSRPNRRKIWDAVVRLFVQLHCKGVYWGDASLANMMVLFAKEKVPEIGYRTVLRAVLADAETVEIQSTPAKAAPTLSEKLRRADVDYFLESMLWTEADLLASGITRDALMTREDQEYILNRYLDLFEVEREEQKFELITKIDVDALLGTFDHRGQSKALLKHIYEHKWYLSERKRKEVPIEDAANDWYTSVFKPVIQLFAEFEILDEFPESTPTSLYLEIMEHKYYLSEKMGKDVGLMAAFEDLGRKHNQNQNFMRKLATLVKSAHKFLPVHLFTAA